LPLLTQPDIVAVHKHRWTRVSSTLERSDSYPHDGRI
jgi:hypothetical protein